MFEINRLIRSFKYAGKGLKNIFAEEQSFRIQVLAGIIVLVLAFLLKIKVWEIIVLLLIIMMVLILELINSIFERIVDILKPRMHPYVELIKNVMSAIVLIASLTALIIGIIIFYPYLAKFFE